jgi:hypothetical protein
MKLMLNGPQALTIFTIAKDEQVPASAKTSSFATPQGYYCTETNKLHMFIKGNEYCFIDMEEHERVVTEALGKSDLKGRLSTQEILAAIGTKTTSSAS